MPILAIFRGGGVSHSPVKPSIRSMMNLCLSFDHRLVDGAYAAQFMKELRESLETWDETRY